MYTAAAGLAPAIVAQWPEWATTACALFGLLAVGLGAYAIAGVAPGPAWLRLLWMYGVQTVIFYRGLANIDASVTVPWMRVCAQVCIVMSYSAVGWFRARAVRPGLAMRSVCGHLYGWTIAQAPYGKSQPGFDALSITLFLLLGIRLVSTLRNRRASVTSPVAPPTLSAVPVSMRSSDVIMMVATCRDGAAADTAIDFYFADDEGGATKVYRVRVDLPGRHTPLDLHDSHWWCIGEYIESNGHRVDVIFNRNQIHRIVVRDESTSDGGGPWANITTMCDVTFGVPFDNSNPRFRDFIDDLVENGFHYNDRCCNNTSDAYYVRCSAPDGRSKRPPTDSAPGRAPWFCFPHDSGAGWGDPQLMSSSTPALGDVIAAMSKK